MTPTMHQVCAWCGADMGEVECETAQAGKTSHGMCRRCSDVAISRDILSGTVMLIEGMA